MKIEKIKGNKIKINLKNNTKKFNDYFGYFLSFEYDYKENISKFNENFQVLRTQSLADKKFLFNQIPQENFPEENNQHAKILLWSLEYIYWLRNLLFHSIINPFDKDLNNLFKYAYFTLQDIVDDNIKWINKKDEEALR